MLGGARGKGEARGEAKARGKQEWRSGERAVGNADQSSSQKIEQ